MHKKFYIKKELNKQVMKIRYMLLNIFRCKCSKLTAIKTEIWHFTTHCTLRRLWMRLVISKSGWWLNEQYFIHNHSIESRQHPCMDKTVTKRNKFMYSSLWIFGNNSIWVRYRTIGKVFSGNRISQTVCLVNPSASRIYTRGFCSFGL